MSTASAAVEPVPTPAPSLDILTLLARVNARLSLLRSWLSHSHVDEPFWWARRITVAKARLEREQLRCLAHTLHVTRATARGRIHGACFASLDEQRAWLVAAETRTCKPCAALVGVPDDATLVQLREGRLPL